METVAAGKRAHWLRWGKVYDGVFANFHGVNIPIAAMMSLNAEHTMGKRCIQVAPPLIEARSRPPLDGD